jgi:hypothetical protein
VLTRTDALSRVITSLSRHVIDMGPQADTHNPVDRPEDQARPLGLRQRPAEPENHAAVVLEEHTDTAQEVQRHERKMPGM